MQHTQPLVSIIIPVYKVEEILRRCLDTVCTQTYEKLEILLVDDGSPDNSGAVCEAYARADARIRVIHTRNEGVSSARNTGIDYSTGSLLMFVDSDDYIERDMVQVLVSHHQPGRMLVCGYQEENVVGDDDHTSIKIFAQDEEVSVFPLKGLTALYERFLLNSPWNKLYEAEAIRENHIRFPRHISLGEDLLFNLEYLAMGKPEFHVVNRPLYHYINVNSGSLSNRFHPGHLELKIQLNEAMITYCTQKLGIEGSEMDIVYHRYYRHLVDEFEQVYLHDASQGKRSSLRTVHACLQRPEVRRVIGHELFRKRHLERWFLQHPDYPGFRRYVGMKKTIRKWMGKRT